MKIQIHTRLCNSIAPETLSSIAGERSQSELRSVILGLAVEVCPWMDAANLERISDEVLQETMGLGPLEPLLQDNSISDILVTTPKMVYVERAGRLYESPVEFRDDNHLIRVIERIVSRVGRRVDE
ncbi:MAG TPA: hypothetical protein VLH09_13960, partial [Bryobacteraceae bacterium]|nr:hypothetical protein [Bryobacteraceae bacterium]